MGIVWQDRSKRNVGIWKGALKHTDVKDSCRKSFTFFLFLSFFFLLLDAFIFLLFIFSLLVPFLVLRTLLIRELTCVSYVSGRELDPAVCNLWVVTHLGVEWPFNKGLAKILENTNVYIKTHNSSKIQLWSSIENDFIVGGHHMRNCIKEW